jgi:photosystem II stability/assembly factor-like uncharacterized protein
VIAAGNLWLALPSVEAQGKKRESIQSNNERLNKGLPARKFARRRLVPPAPPAEPNQGRESIEEIEGRKDWFLFQRMYPSNTIPRDARLRAWESARRIRTESLITPAASRAWRSVGPIPTVSHYPNNWGVTSGRVNAIAVSPANPRIVVVGAATGGLWRSTDSGATFAPVADDQVDIAVGSIAFSQSSPSVAYAAMGDTKVGYLGSGVLKSTNEGRTWSRVSNSSLPSPATVAKIEVDPSDANRVYIAQYTRLATDRVTSSGVYVSTDGGVNWIKTLTGGARDVVIDAGNSRTIYAGLMRVDAAGDPPAGLYRSTDRGSTWTNILTAQYTIGLRRDIKIAVSRANPQMIYVYMGGFTVGRFEARLIASTDGGATWADRGTGGFDTGQFGYNTFIIADPANPSTVYLGSRDVYRSTDGGINWFNLTRNFFPVAGFHDYTPEASKSHPDQHALAFVPGSSHQFYIGNDGGVSKTTDGGATFQSLNSTLTLTQFIGIAVHPTDAGLTVGGSQDNGAQLRNQSGLWREISAGDGGRTVFNPLDPSIVFVTRVRGAVLRYRDGGQTFDDQVAYDETFGEPTGGARIAFYPPFVGNGIDQTLYLGTWRLFTSTDLGASWNAPAGDLDFTKGFTDRGADLLNAIGVGRADTRVIYTGSVQGRAMRTTDGGTTWTDVTAGLPNRSITSVAVHPTDPAIAYLSVSGFNAGHVFKTTDFGATWVDASSGLPDVPANALLFDPLSSDTLYVGTDVGVFRSTAGAAWEGFNKGLPPVVVTGFAAQPTGLIQVATYGRGAYEMAGLARPSIASASFNGKKRLTIEGSGFDESLRLIINGEERTGRISSVSETTVTVSGKMKKMGLKAGDNSIQIISSDNITSNVFTLKLL